MQDFDYNSLGAGYYDKILSEGATARRFWHIHKFHVIESLISVRKTASILDIGCAAGSFLGHLTVPFERAVGLDISAEQVAYAQGKYGSSKIHFLKGDIRTHDLDGQTFDCIVISEIIEHIPYSDTLKIFKKLRGRLNPGGRIIVTSPNYRSLWPVIEWFLNRVLPIGYDHQHITHFTPKRMTALIQEIGLKVEHQSTFFIVAPFLPWIPVEWKHKLCDLETRLFPSWGSIVVAVAS